MLPEVTGWLVAIATLASATLGGVWWHAKTRRYVVQLEEALRGADAENRRLGAELHETMNSSIPYSTFNGYIAALMLHMGRRQVILQDEVLESFENELIYVHHDMDRQQTLLQLQGPSQSMH
jgi:hypothetical protein